MTATGWSPEKTRPEALGDPLEPLGRAARFRCEGGEVWTLPLADEGIARRLVTLGASNLGGFRSGGIDQGGVWLVRAPSPRTAETLARGERLPWRDAFVLVLDVARALAACERAALFPGALRPSEVVLGQSHAWLSADRLVAAMVGGSGETRTATAPSPKWTPPEQSSGAPWDNAANRYVLGLVAYRLIAGSHPFAGAGLRNALAEQVREAPPFDDAISRDLLPGVQSLVLKMLRADASARFEDAESLAGRISDLLDGVKPPSAEAAPGMPAAAPRARAARTNPARAVGSRFSWPHALPLLGIGIAAAMYVASPAKSAGQDAPKVAPRAPLTSTTAADCAPCHSRHVAEWERSVMAHAAKSPLFGALESVVEEQVGRDDRCPNGAGILRRAGGDACRDERTGSAVTGSGGEHWCVNCHAMGENLRAAMPAWNANGASSSRAPVRDLLGAAAMEGISCAGCHQTIGPVALHGAARSGSYEGNPTWTSIATGQIFRSRPEDGQGRRGIANSGYLLDPAIFLGKSDLARSELAGADPGVHRRPPGATQAYLQSSEFCGACHDVRLFGSDALARDRGEHFKRLRNAYTEWRTWADAEKAVGRAAPTCQGCHMSLYPGICASGPGATGNGCPSGSHFEARPAGDYAQMRTAPSSPVATHATQHYFTSVDVPLAESFAEAYLDDTTLDAAGLPVGLRARRDLLLQHTFRFDIGSAHSAGGRLEVPLRITNTGAGHRVPAGFSQEREIWVALTVKDARGGVVYEVGNLPGNDADLRDKVFLRVTTSEGAFDGRGRPQGVFGADVTDGPDVPAWSPNPSRGGTTFRGRGLINLQNGFLRCVRCIGTVDGEGACQPGPGQGRTRADRFADGAYDTESGECRSNLEGSNAFFETYFPVGALDADRGLLKAPDAIIDTRSAPPGVELTYTYVVDLNAHPAPYTIDARLKFRAFPPYLVRAFAAYEARKAAQGLRPSGAQVTERMIRRLEVTDIARAQARVE